MSLQSTVNSLSNEVYILKNPCSKITLNVANNKLNYKDDFLNEQISNSTTLILSVIGFALVFAGVFTYFFGKSVFLDVLKQFRLKINEVRAEVRQAKNTNEKNYNDIRVKHNDFEFSLNYNQGNFYVTLYNKYVDDKNTEMSLYYALIAFSDFTTCCLSTSVKNDAEFKIEKVEYIKNGLNNLTEFKNYKVNIEFGGTIQNNITNIRKIDNVEIDILLSKLQASITYENRKVS
ncbi:hypothetical protein [Flavobacterium sandaracinum]|uniref:Uncharacterized protein n=1 Tax=Flavobacterium sandaracinum TaxID=2541733 RepID=A0A4R5CSH0_9FLAO|nr:hypothetical protein [Flavobacterium sandaracinum]TDE01831.1 hypothetical protein E0F91_13500 [Flavobacterium sandaracinum]